MHQQLLRLTVVTLSLVAVPTAFADDASDVAKRVEKVCQEMRFEGVKLSTSGKIVFIDGSLQVPAYGDKLKKVVAAFQTENPGLVFQNLTVVDPQAWIRLAERAERQIGAPEVIVRVVGRTVFLEGTAENDYQADRAVTITRTFFRPTGADRESASATPNDDFQITDLLRVLPPNTSPLARLGKAAKKSSSR